MTKTYELTSTRRLVNRILTRFIRLGLMPVTTQLLTVRGRTTGKLYSTPVSLVIDGKRRYLVSPYGIVNWVKNARAAGEVSLTHGRKTQMCRLRELPPEEAAPILKTYLQKQPITRPYFAVTADSPLEDFAAEAPKHPAFELLSP